MARRKGPWLGSARVRTALLVAVPLASVAMLVFLLARSTTGAGFFGDVIDWVAGGSTDDNAADHALERLRGSAAHDSGSELVRVSIGAHRTVPGSPDGFPCPGPEPENPLNGHLPEDASIASPPGEAEVVWTSNISSVTVYKDDITRVCTLSNICWDAVRDQLLFVVDSADARDQVRRELAACQASTTFAWCKCVMGATTVNVATTRDVEAYELLKDETWFLDHYVSSHHFGHWQETVGIFFAALRREDYYHFGRIRNIFVPRMRPPLKEPEQFYLDLALSILSYKTDGVMWAHEEDGTIGRMAGYCFERAHTSSITGRMAMTVEDAWALRVRAYETLNLPLRTCPGRKTVLMIRGEDVAAAKRQRLLLNMEDILARLHHRGLTDVVVSTITDRNSTAEQSCLFAMSGLVISAHSSQLVNMAMALPGSAIIELTVGVQPFDFGETADLLGIHHQMIFTGQTPDVDTTPEIVRTCHNALLECLGERHHDCLEPIFLNNPACQSADYRTFAKEQKNADFFVSMDHLELALDRAIASLQTVCGGYWSGIR